MFNDTVKRLVEDLPHVRGKKLEIMEYACDNFKAVVDCAEKVVKAVNGELVRREKERLGGGKTQEKTETDTKQGEGEQESEESA